MLAQTQSAPDPNEQKRRSGKRNVNGEGSIRQRSDGRWEGRAYVVTTDGREVRRSLYGKSWDEVHDSLTRLQADRMAGVRVPGTTWNVAEYLAYWLQEIVHDRVRDTTYASYAWMIRVYLEPALGTKKLAKLQVSDIRQAFSRLKEVCQCCALGKDQQREERAQATRAIQSARAPRKNARKIEGARCCALRPRRCCQSTISDGTIRYVHRILRSALQDAVSEGILTQNVAKNLRLSQRYRPKFVPWTGAEARLFLRASEGDRCTRSTRWPCRSV